MSVDVLLLILRVVTAAALLAFSGAVFAVLWRDYHASARFAEGVQRQQGRLVVVRAGDGMRHNGADLVGASFPLLPLTSVGRAPTNTIVLDEPFASQEHALVTRRGGQWWLEDRDSSNGTRLNGQQVTVPVVLSSGDVIEIGRVQLKIELE